MAETGSDIGSRIRALQDRFLVMSRDRERAQERLEKLVREKDEVAALLDARMKAVEFIEKVAERERASVKEGVENLVADCLHAVYGDDYGVEFDYGKRAGKTSVEISVVRKCDDGVVVKRGIDGIGGGVADTVSLPLKLIVLLNDGAVDRVLVTDEPGKHLDSGRVVEFARFIRAVSHRLGVQVIMSSHHAVMREYADRMYEVSIEGSQSSVRRVK